MNILVMGIGGVGGYVGGKLAQTPHHITFIARGKHLEAIKRDGLFVKSILGDFHAKPSLVTAVPSEAPPPEAVILAVKSWQLEEAAGQLAPVLSKNTIVLPLQNGVDAAERLQKILPAENIAGGVCRIVSFIEAPGKIYHKAISPQLLFAELNGEKTPRIMGLKQLFDQAGIDSNIPPDIQTEIWRKFLFICTISGLAALCRCEMGVVRQDDYLRSLLFQTAEEIMVVANAKGVVLTGNDIASCFAAIDAQPWDTTASMQRDIMAGKPSELETFNGYIAREGRRLGIPTPVNECIYRLLAPMETKARKIN